MIFEIIAALRAKVVVIFDSVVPGVVQAANCKFDFRERKKGAELFIAKAQRLFCFSTKLV